MAHQNCRAGQAAILGICLLFSMLSAGQVLSDPILPYEPGDTLTIHGAAARVANVHCSTIYDGCIFTFDVEVFPSAWQPVYAVEFLRSGQAPFSLVSWPAGWSVRVPPYLAASLDDVLVIETDSEPILPGSKRSGFAIATHSMPFVLRWYPADKSGVLVGRASAENFACPLAAEPGTWGAIKAMFR